MPRPATIAERLQNAGVVIQQPLQLRSGEISDYYIDIKQCFGDTELLHELAAALLQKFDADISTIAACGYGGIPLATAASLQTGLPLVLVRDTAKSHGRQNLIDGYAPTADDTIAIIDDVFTTGSSIRHTIAALEPTNATIAGCYVVASRGEAPTDLSLYYLVSAEELL